MTDNYRRPLGAWIEAGAAAGLIVMVPDPVEEQPVTVGVITKSPPVYPPTGLFEENQT